MGTFVIIGLCGAPGSGKSTAAEYLHERYGLMRLRFADPLKNMLRAYYRTLGLSERAIERRIEGDMKTTEDPSLGGVSPRYAMQTLGTEWGRNLVGDALWTAAWAMRVGRASLDGAPGVVCEDLRFPNEAAELRALGCLLVRVVRPGQANVAGGIVGHSSEGQSLSPDITVSNCGDRVTLGPAIASALRGHTRGDWL